MAFLTTPDLTAEPVEVGRLLVPGSTEDDLNLCPNHLLGATGSMTSETRILISRTTPKEISSRPSTSRNPSNKKSRCALNPSHSRLSTIPSNRSRNQSCLLTLGSAEEWHLNLCPMASCYVLAAAGPLAKDESCPIGSAEECHLNLCPVAIYCVLAAATPLAKDESCPIGSAEERRLNLCPVAVY